MTDTPYSDQWRAVTRMRMKSLGLSLLDIADHTGLEAIALLDLFDGSGIASLDDIGPIDELLDNLEAEHEAHALDIAVAHHHGVGSPTVRRVEVELGSIVDAKIIWTLK